MRDPGIIESRSSALVGLPLEVQGLIFDNLNQFELSRLCLTCKFIRGVVLPKLYDAVIIKVPQRWSQLPSLEGLLSSDGDGLKYTIELNIETQQDPLRDRQRESEDSLDPGEDLTDITPQCYLPQRSTSNTLNTLIRLLLFKIPKHQLQLFDWKHSCELDVSTLNLLIERQKESLRFLYLGRYASLCDESGSTVGGLEELEVNCMDLDRGDGWWAATMVVGNAESLRHLSLGFSAQIAYEFALERRPKYDEMSVSFGHAVEASLLESHLKRPIQVSLDSLRLCGLDFGKVIQGEMALDINFNSITQLRLESCPGLRQAFSLLKGPGVPSKLGLDALEDLYVRRENPGRDFSSTFKRFLTSIRGLKYLRVLVDGAFQAQDLQPILKVHGQTLEGLVWDERSGPRTFLDLSTSVLPLRAAHGNLSLISQYCPHLRELGIPLDWKAIKERPCSKAIRRYCGKMPDLATLNIRNPPTFCENAPMPMDYFVKGLAAMVVDIVTQRGKTSLGTIALGAPFYRDLTVGTHHVVHTDLSDLLRLRVYHIDQNYRSPTGLSPVLSEITMGAVCSTEEDLYPSHLLDSYWLG